MERVRVLVRRMTVVLLVTSTVLLVPGLLGIGASVLFTVALVGTGLVLATARTTLTRAPTVLGYHLDRYLPDLWIAAFGGAALLVIFPDASAAELQSLGGLAGFLGMVNYFLVPVYLFVYSLVLRAGGIGTHA